jgi:preprotein translocase subunit SecE
MIYKQHQGRYVRSLTGVGLGFVDLALCYYIYLMLGGHLPESTYKAYLVYAIPAVVFAGLGAVAFFYMNTPRVGDFLIATESEMKKVSWSSKAELIGSTAVVIGTVLLLALIIWIADTLITMGYTRGLGLWGR